MLNKEYCRKCRIAYIANEYFPHSFPVLDMSFDSCWNSGIVCCPKACKEDARLGYSINNKPPEQCPYLLEHLMQEGEKNE